MAETVREQILAKLKTMLSNITIENGYRTDIASVQRYMQHGNSLSDVPCIIISAGADRWEANHTVIIQANFTVFIDLWIRQSEDDSTPTDKVINNAIADIYECLWSDTTLGGYALDVNFASIEQFETIEGQPHAGATIELNVMYRFLQTDPESAG